MRSAPHGGLVANVYVFCMLTPRMIEIKGGESEIVYNGNKIFSVGFTYDVAYRYLVFFNYSRLTPKNR